MLKNRKQICIQKHIILFAAVLIFCMFFCLTGVKTVQAAPVVNQNPETGYLMLIDDMARLLGQGQENALMTQMEEISAFGHVGFVSVEEHDYSSHMDFASDYYKSYFGTDSGTLFVIDMKLRKITLFNDGQIEKTVTKGYANSITDNIYTYASDGDFFTCASKAYEQVLKLLNGRKIAQPMKYASNFFLALILALLINYIRARLMSSAYKASDDEWLEKLTISYDFSNLRVKLHSTVRRYSPQSSGDGGGSRSGGGGGGHSGSGGSHSF